MGKRLRLLTLKKVGNREGAKGAQNKNDKKYQVMHSKFAFTEVNRLGIWRGPVSFMLAMKFVARFTYAM